MTCSECGNIAVHWDHDDSNVAGHFYNPGPAILTRSDLHTEQTDALPKKKSKNRRPATSWGRLQPEVKLRALRLLTRR